MEEIPEMGETLSDDVENMENTPPPETPDVEEVHEEDGHEEEVHDEEVHDEEVHDGEVHDEEVHDREVQQVDTEQNLVSEYGGSDMGESLASSEVVKKHERPNPYQLPPTIRDLEPMEPIEITIEYLKRIQQELGLIELCWPDIELPHFEKRAHFPDSYVQNSDKEKLLLLHAENFRRQFNLKYPRRKQLLLACDNECGRQKMVCTTLRPTKLPFQQIAQWQDCAKCVGDFLAYEPQLVPTLIPSRILSPYTVFMRQSGHSFELSTALCSLLLGMQYDAYVVSGYAVRDVTLHIMRRMEPPTIFDVEKEPPPPEQQPVETKYKLKEVKDLRSKFLLEMAQKESDKIENEKKRREDVHRKEMEILEAPPPDDLNGMRVHSWVLLLAGKRGVEETVFIEPSTGCYYPTNNTLFNGIESVWNHLNYWVNLQDCSEGLDKIEYDLSDVKKWEHLLVGEPIDKRVLVLDVTMDDDEKEEQAIFAEKHLDMPGAWSEKIYIPYNALLNKYPNGVQKRYYLRTLVERMAPFVQEDGLVTKITHFEDFECNNPYQIEEIYKNRDDRMIKRTYDLSNDQTTETFRRGREDCCKTHIYTATMVGPLDDRVIEYYSQGRVDALKRMQMSATFMNCEFDERDDHLTHLEVTFAKKGFPPPGIQEGKRRIVIYILQNYSRNLAKHANEDIAHREFDIVSNEIHLRFHYGQGKVTASSRYFVKPPTAEVASDKMTFNPELTFGYVAEIDKKPPRLLKLYNLLESQIRAEDHSMRYIIDLEDEVSEFLRNRALELGNPKLNVPLFDREHNYLYEAGLAEREKEEVEHKAREVGEEMDYLAPYIARLGNSTKLSFGQAYSVREKCIAGFKRTMVDRANCIQEQYEEKQKFCNDKKQWYEQFQDTLSLQDEIDFFEELNTISFMQQTLEMRLVRLTELTPLRYMALEQFLKNDERLACLYRTSSVVYN